MKKKTRDILIVIASAVAIFVIAAIVMLFPGENSDSFVRKQAFEGTNEIVLTTAEPVQADLLIPSTFTVFEQNDPDIQMHPTQVVQNPHTKDIRLTFAEPLNQSETHIIKAPELKAGTGPVNVEVARSYFAYLISIMISALLINNYVFTKYLGLCVFI